MVERVRTGTRRRFATLRAILTAVVDAELLGRSPCRKTKLPASTPAARHVVSPDELRRLAEAIRPADEAVVYLGAVLGLRIGECLALRVGRLDLLRNTLTVAESVSEVHGQLVCGEPKSEAGRRTLTMPNELVTIIAAHLTRRGLTAAQPDALVFVSPSGGPARPTNWRERRWIPATKAAGLDGLRFHDLRKAAATAMVTSGVDVRTAQARLGHADPRLTNARRLRAGHGGRGPECGRAPRRALPERARKNRSRGARGMDAGWTTRAAEQRRVRNRL